MQRKYLSPETRRRIQAQRSAIRILTARGRLSPVHEQSSPPPALTIRPNPRSIFTASQTVRNNRNTGSPRTVRNEVNKLANQLAKLKINNKRLNLAQQFKANSARIGELLATKVHRGERMKISRSNLIRARTQLKPVAPLSRSQLHKKGVNVLRSQLRRHISDEEVKKLWNNSDKLYKQGQYLNAFKKLQTAREKLFIKKGANALQTIARNRIRNLNAEQSREFSRHPTRHHHYYTPRMRGMLSSDFALRNASRLEASRILGFTPAEFSRALSMMSTNSKEYRTIVHFIKDLYNKLNNTDSLKTNYAPFSNNKIIPLHSKLKERFNKEIKFLKSNKYRNKAIYVSKVSRRTGDGLLAFFSSFNPPKNIINRVGPKPPIYSEFETKKLWLTRVFAAQHENAQRF